MITGVNNIPGVSETLYIINAPPLFVFATSSNFFHSKIQCLLPMDLVSSSAAEFMVSTAAFAFWYFWQRDVTAITFGKLPWRYSGKTYQSLPTSSSWNHTCCHPGLPADELYSLF